VKKIYVGRLGKAAGKMPMKDVGERQNWSGKRKEEEANATRKRYSS